MNGSFTNAREGERELGNLAYKELSDDKNIWGIPDISGHHVQCGICYSNLEYSVWNMEVICRDRTFNVVAIMKVMGLHVQCRQCSICYQDLEYSVWNTELTSFHLGWFSGVIWTVCDAREYQRLTVWCIRICSSSIDSVSSNYLPYLEYVCGPNHIWLFCTNARLSN